MTTNKNTPFKISKESLHKTALPPKVKLAWIYGVSSQFMLRFAALVFRANSACAASVSFIGCAHPKYKNVIIYQKQLVFLRLNNSYSVYFPYVPRCFETCMSEFNCGDAAYGGEVNCCALLLIDPSIDAAFISYPGLTTAKHKYKIN